MCREPIIKTSIKRPFSRLLLVFLALVTITGCATHHSSLSNGYKVTNEGVYWSEYSVLSKKNKLKKIFNSDQDTFQVIKQPKKYRKELAKDKRYVYRKGFPIPFADPNSFISIGSNYSRDSEFVYFKGDRVTGIKSSDFKVLEDSIVSSYGKTSKFGIYKNIPFELCESDSFKHEKQFSDSWSLDSQCAYYKGHKLSEIDRNTFKILSYYFSKDSNTVFFKDKPIIDADPNTFVSLNYSMSSDVVVAKDVNNCWNRNAEMINCISKRKIKRGKAIAFMNAQELKSATHSLVASFFEKRSNSEKKALRNHEKAVLTILSEYDSLLLKNDDIPSINLSNLKSGFSVTLKSTVKSPIGAVDKITYVFRKKENENIYFDVFNTQVRGVLTEIRNLKGRIIQEASISKYSSSQNLYTSETCRFESGECIESYTRLSLKTGTTFKSTRQVKNEYQGGVWINSVTNENKNEKYNIKSKTIYDSYGFPIYKIIFNGRSLDNEYISIR